MPASNSYRAVGEVASFELPVAGGPAPGAIAAYKRDGVICLRGAFGRDWLDVIESGIEQAMALHGSSAGKVTPEGGEGFFYYDSIMWKKVEPFRRFIFESHAADLFWPLLESKSLNFYYDFLLVKSAHCAGAATPWHQDHSYYPLNGTKIINCWTALDPPFRQRRPCASSGARTPRVRSIASCHSARALNTPTPRQTGPCRPISTPNPTPIS